jgi:hypothetical protein
MDQTNSAASVETRVPPLFANLPGRIEEKIAALTAIRDIFELQYRTAVGRSADFDRGRLRPDEQAER